MDHIDRLNRTIEYIEANLDKNIHLELLASKFALSKYHFHRIFKALIGEPPSRYIEKREGKTKTGYFAQIEFFNRRTDLFRQGYE